MARGEDATAVVHDDSGCGYAFSVVDIWGLMRRYAASRDHVEDLGCEAGRGRSWGV